MNWYIAMLVYEIVCGKGGHTPQFDEQVRLVLADDNQDAYTKAAAIGRQEAFHFENAAEQLVYWKFLAVAELLPLNRLTDGAEVFSRTLELEQAEGYRRKIMDRSASLQQNLSHAIPSL